MRRPASRREPQLPRFVIASSTRGNLPRAITRVRGEPSSVRVLQLLPVVLGPFFVPRPDDRASAGVDPVREVHALVEAHARADAASACATPSNVLWLSLRTITCQGASSPPPGSRSTALWTGVSVAALMALERTNEPRRLRPMTAGRAARALCTPRGRGGLEHRRGPSLWLSALPSTRRSSGRSPLRVRARRPLRRRRLPDPHVRRSRIQHAPEDTLDWSPPWVLALIDTSRRSTARMIAITGDPEPELFADLDRRRASARRDAGSSERYCRRPDTADRLDDRRLPERGLGEGGVRRARRRAALGCRCDRDPPRRGRSGRCVARAHREARRARRDPQRAPASTACASAAPAPTYRRPDPAVALVHGRRETVDGRRARGEHAHRGGVHDAPPPPHRGHRPLDDAARVAGRSCATSRCASRPAASSRSRRRTGADVVREQMSTDDGAAYPRRGRARRRRLARRQDRASSSSTRSSTRTRPATSPTGPGFSSRSRAARRPDDRSSRSSAATTRPCTPTS